MKSLDGIFAEQVRLHPDEARSHFEIVDPDVWRVVEAGNAYLVLNDGSDWRGPFSFSVGGIRYEAYAHRNRCAESQRLFLEDWGVEVPEDNEDVLRGDNGVVVPRNAVKVILYCVRGLLAVVIVLGLWLFVSEELRGVNWHKWWPTKSSAVVEMRASKTNENKAGKNQTKDSALVSRQSDKEPSQKKKPKNGEKARRPNEDSFFMLMPLTIGVVSFCVIWGLLRLASSIPRCDDKRGMEGGASDRGL